MQHLVPTLGNITVHSRPLLLAAVHHNSPYVAPLSVYVHKPCNKSAYTVEHILERIDVQDVALEERLGMRSVVGVV